jgi:hypothetical protein
MSDWLDLQLSHQLAAVQAPEALWDRIQNGAMARPVQPRAESAALWPIAAILTFAVAAGTLWLVARGAEPALDLRQLAIEQLQKEEGVSLHSSDPAQISAWLRRAGFDLTLPAERAENIRLVGARLIEKHGAQIGEIQYQVGSDRATLLVARAESVPEGGHGQSVWRSHGQSYAVASSNPERPDAPCLLCHTTL